MKDKRIHSVRHLLGVAIREIAVPVAETMRLVGAGYDDAFGQFEVDALRKFTSAIVHHSIMGVVADVFRDAPPNSERERLLQRTYERMGGIVELDRYAIAQATHGRHEDAFAAIVHMLGDAYEAWSDLTKIISRSRYSPNDVALAPDQKRHINIALEEAGLGGHKPFKTAAEAMTTATDVVRSFGVEPSVLFSPAVLSDARGTMNVDIETFDGTPVAGTELSVRWARSDGGARVVAKLV